MIASCASSVIPAGAGQALLVVRDTDVGISVEDLPRIWDRLYRGDKSRSQRGLGLGLSLVKAVVQAHQGRVEVALIRAADRSLRYPCLSPRLSRVQQSLKNVILAKAASNGCARLNLPPWYYVPLHPEAKLSDEERELIVKRSK